jgi:hypothetical protein
MVRKNQEYYVLVNMASRRIDGMQSCLQLADVYDFFAADGTTFFMRSGDEYRRAMGAFEITAHPGVTSRYGDEHLIPGRNMYGHCSLENFAAGVVSPHGACSGFIFEKMRGIDKYPGIGALDIGVENDQEWIYGVRAHKAFFFIGDQFIALGAGIINKKSELGGEIRTTIDQTLANRTVLNGTGVQAKDSLRFLLKPANDLSVPVVSIENNGFTYQVISEQTTGEVWALLEQRATRWDELNVMNKDVLNKPQSADIFQLWINHGNNPENDRYGYVVYCGNDPVPPVPRVLSNQRSSQSVASPSCHVIHAVFYKPDSVLCDATFFQVSAPCAFTAEIDADSVLIAVCDAEINPDLDSITVITSLPVANTGDSAKRRRLAIALPVGEYRGAQATAKFALD